MGHLVIHYYCTCIIVTLLRNAMNKNDCCLTRPINSHHNYSTLQENVKISTLRNAQPLVHNSFAEEKYHCVLHWVSLSKMSKRKRLRLLVKFLQIFMQKLLYSLTSCMLTVIIANEWTSLL